MSSQRKHALIILGLGAAVALSITVAGVFGGYRINMTPSFPLGLWRIEPLQHDARAGDTVFICPPQTPDFDLALRRHYLPRGLCPGDAGPLIKTIVATSGQSISVVGAVFIDGKRLEHSDVQTADAAGRALPVFASGSVPPGQVFLHSNFPGSYDSRYFGPVPAAGILGRAVPAFTFTP